jgi:hypothetical protein
VPYPLPSPLTLSARLAVPLGALAPAGGMPVLQSLFFHERQISLEQARFYSRQIGRRVLAETALAAAVLFPIGEVLA